MRAFVVVGLTAWIAVGCGGGPTTDTGGGGPATHTLTIDVQGPGLVRSAVLPGDCRGSCTATVAASTEVELDGIADASSFIQGWSGNCFMVAMGTGGAGDTSICKVLVSTDVRIGATFIRIPERDAGPGGGDAAWPGIFR